MRRIICRILWGLLLVAGLLQAKTFRFTVPLQDLQEWSKSVVAEIEATIEGHSGVHLASKDCEMHFGASVPSYKGQPQGWVFEPMNICKEPFFGTEKVSKKAWVKFAEDLTSQKVTASGVPRIWPEHLTGEDHPSNPNHALELHPLTILKEPAGTRDFRKFIYAPEGFTGISETTQESIFKTISLTARKKPGELVEMEMKTTGSIGNFATLEVLLDPKTIKPAGGGHRLLGEADFGGGDRYPVRLISVEGSEIDQKIAKMKDGQKKRRLEVLALFSLNPLAVLEILGGKKKGGEPLIQLILYGETEHEE